MNGYEDLTEDDKQLIDDLISDFVSGKFKQSKGKAKGKANVTLRCAHCVCLLTLPQVLSSPPSPVKPKPVVAARTAPALVFIV